MHDLQPNEPTPTSERTRRRPTLPRWLSRSIPRAELLPFLEGVPDWVAAAIVAFVALGYTHAFELSVDLARWFYTHERYALFIWSPACFVLASWLVKRFAPAAGGSGVPQVARALEQEQHTSEAVEQTLSLRVALVVIASSLLCMMGAGSLGREGPMIHIAACIFFVTGRALSRWWPVQEHRSWIIAGGAAGVAAAFNAPLAGVVFALEELAEQHFKQFKTFLITSAIVAGAIAQWLSGKYLYFGYPNVGSITVWSLPWAAFIGLLAGIIAMPFHQAVATKNMRRLTDAVESRLSNNRFRLSIAFVCGVAMAAMAIFVDPHSIGGGLDVVGDLLMTDHVIEISLSLFIARFLGTIISHVSGVAGGFLGPSLAIGAITGALLDQWTGFGNHHLSVMIGMAAVLSATARAPFTAWVIVMEMTDRHSVIFPLMIAAVVSSTVATWPQRRLLAKNAA
jgi:H+/Cl- antiporter ClcA